MRTHTFRLTLGLLALVCAIASLTPSRAQTPPVTGQPTRLTPFGMNTYFTGLERNGRDGDAGVAALIAEGRQLGVQWAREELSWANLERDGKGRWLWSHFDRRLLATAQAGYGIVGMLLTTPAWARVADCPQRAARYAGAGVVALDYWCPPANPKDFADYVSAVVERYDGDGLADAPGSPRVAAWQLWNEPNAWETWPGTPAEYGVVLEAGYAAAKAADPSAIVATGGLYVLDSAWRDEVGHWDGLRFFDEALAAYPAAWRSFDALAIHPYMPDVAPDQPGLYGLVTMWGRITTSRRWLNERTGRLGGPFRPIWISEVGWSTCTAGEADCYAGAAAATLAETGAQPAHDWRLTLGPAAAGSYQAPDCAAETTACAALLAESSPAALIGKSEQQQASYLTRTYAMALAQGVQHLSWFQLEDKFDGSARNFWEEAAILRPAALGYTQKPAAAAYRAVAALLGGTSFLGFGPLNSFGYLPTQNNPEARYHLRFSGDSTRVDLIWRNRGAEEVSLPLTGVGEPQVFNRDGQPVAARVEGGALRLSIGEAPVYIRQRTAPVVTRILVPLAGR